MMLLLLACSLMQTKVVALSPARRSLLPRAPRTATALRAAGDDALPPYDGYEDEVAKRRISRDNVGVSFGASATATEPLDGRAARLKQLLQDEDFDAAERESAAALAVLPELADVARMRGRALLSPLLDKLIDGGAVGKADFEGAYEAYRLASVMNPDDSAEADEALGRIRDLCQKLETRDKDDLEEVIETTGKAVEEKALRFGRGARVVCNTGRKADAPWEAGTVVALFHREEGWAPGEVVPYQVRLNDGTLIYAPFDADGCIRLRSGDDLDVDVVVVGAGAAGIGCAVSLTRAFGLDPARVRLLERSDAVGASFRAWPEEMRFISPSFTVHKIELSRRVSTTAQPWPPLHRRDAGSMVWPWRSLTARFGQHGRVFAVHPTHRLVYAQVVQPAGLDELVRPERRGPGHVAGVCAPRAASVGLAVRRLSRGAGG
jgi:hypothetical protein